MPESQQQQRATAAAAAAMSASAPAYWPPASSSEATATTTSTTARTTVPPGLRPSQVRQNRNRGQRRQATNTNTNTTGARTSASASAAHTSIGGETTNSNANSTARPKRKPRNRRRGAGRVSEGVDHGAATVTATANANTNTAHDRTNATRNGNRDNRGNAANNTAPGANRNTRGGSGNADNKKNNRKGKGKKPVRKKPNKEDDGLALVPSKEWWGKSEEVDPITMEPISHLRYPPFELHADSGGTRQTLQQQQQNNTEVNGGSDVVHLFDGKVLAQYIVSTGTFLNPNNRHELSRQTCHRLDVYLSAHRLGKPVVTEAFDLSRIASTSATSTDAERQEALRREASALLGNMFQFNRYTPGDAVMLAGGEEEPRAFTGTNQRSRQRARDSGVAPSVVHQDGNFAVIDGDEWVHLQDHGGLDTVDFPDLAAQATTTTAAASNVPSSARVWGYATTSHGDFPTLEEVQHNLPSGARAASVWAAASGTHSAVRTAPVAAMQRPAHVILREAYMSSAAAHSGGGGGGGTGPDDTANWRSLSSSAAPAVSGSGGGNVRMMPSAVNVHELLCPYPPRMLADAREFGLNWIVKIESRLYNFVVTNTTTRTMELGEMAANKRKFLHELCHKYWALETASKYWDEHRELFVSRTPGAAPPEVSLVQAISDFGEVVGMSGWESATSESGHAVGLWGMSGGVTAAHVHEAIEQTARRSEYSLRFLDQHNVVVEFASLANARRACNLLKERLGAGKQMGSLRALRVQWWPSGSSWAGHQLRMKEEGERHERKTLREQRRVVREYENENVRREELRTVATAWDSDDEDDNNQRSSGGRANVPVIRGGALARSGGGRLARSGRGSGGLAQSGGRLATQSRTTTAKPPQSDTAGDNHWGALGDDDGDE